MEIAPLPPVGEHDIEVRIYRQHVHQHERDDQRAPASVARSARGSASASSAAAAPITMPSSAPSVAQSNVRPARDCRNDAPAFAPSVARKEPEQQPQARGALAHRQRGEHERRKQVARVISASHASSGSRSPRPSGQLRDVPRGGHPGEHRVLHRRVEPVPQHARQVAEREQERRGKHRRERPERATSPSMYAASRSNQMKRMRRSKPPIEQRARGAARPARRRAARRARSRRDRDSRRRASADRSGSTSIAPDSSAPPINAAPAGAARRATRIQREHDQRAERHIAEHVRHDIERRQVLRKGIGEIRERPEPERAPARKTDTATRRPPAPHKRRAPAATTPMDGAAIA